MKIFPLLLAVLFDVVLAQDGSRQLPDCAKSCATEFGSASGCGIRDIACICRSNNYIRRITCCLIPVCNISDRNQAINFVKDLCRSEGYELPFGDPTTPTCEDLRSSSSSSTSTSRVISISSSTYQRTRTRSSRTSSTYPSPTRTSAQTSLSGGSYYTLSSHTSSRHTSSSYTSSSYTSSSYTSSSYTSSKPRLRLGGKIAVAIGTCVVLFLVVVGARFSRQR